MFEQATWHGKPGTTVHGGPATEVNRGDRRIILATATPLEHAVGTVL
jgi:hypothetical protein